MLPTKRTGRPSLFPNAWRVSSLILIWLMPKPATWFWKGAKSWRRVRLRSWLTKGWNFTAFPRSRCMASFWPITWLTAKPAKLSPKPAPNWTRSCLTRLPKPRSAKSEPCLSTALMSARISETRWKPTRTTAAKRLCLTSIALCARVNRLPMKPPISCLKACSLILSAMTCLRSAA